MCFKLKGVSFSFCNSEKFKEEVSKPEIVQRVKYETSDAFRLDQSKRPKDNVPLQTFRKLNVDWSTLIRSWLWRPASFLYKNYLVEAAKYIMVPIILLNVDFTRYLYKVFKDRQQLHKKYVSLL